jgi:predicted phosphodiesterase
MSLWRTRFGTLGILRFGCDRCFKKIKPLRAVYGNIDDAKARMEFPLHNRFMCEGVEVWITHIGGYPGKYNPAIKAEMAANSPKLFICGHSHILKVMFDKKYDLLHMNPALAEKVVFIKFAPCCAL